MTLREYHNSTAAKYIDFTNGFPRKEMVPTHGLSAGVNVHGGFFVGLHDSATACLTKSQRTIPPLAKRRSNSIALKPRASSSRYRNKKDPFSEHKGTEKVGFTPRSVKRNKPKLERSSPKIEHFVSNATITDSKLTSRLPRPTENFVTSIPENNFATRNPESSNSRILSDIEKKTTLNELIGIDEMYQRVCNGSMDSLYTLISPVKTKKRLKNIPSVQYIQTSSSLLLKQKASQTPQLVITGSVTVEYKAENSGLHNSRSQNYLTRKMCKRQENAILLPLPYFPNPPMPPNTAPVYSKESYSYPKIYPSRLEKQRSGVAPSLSGWSSPSIINFSPVHLADNKRPFSRDCAPTGSIVGVQSKSQTGKVAIMASLDATAAPPATAECEGCQKGFDVGDKNEIINGKWESPEVDSLYSEELSEINTKIEQDNTSEDIVDQKEKISQNDISDMNNCKDISVVEDAKNNDEHVSDGILGTALSIMLNVTDESGAIAEVEIFDSDKRDVVREEQVNNNVLEAQQSYQKKRQELESLLNEHDHLVQQVNELSKELHD